MEACTRRHIWKERLNRFAPGLLALVGYQWRNFGHDLVAGLSVAAVALPVGIAYAQLAGFSPVSGLTRFSVARDS